ncbi:hypothetical protein ACIA8G_14430 [Lentzea sp. NPDC051213]
MRLAVVLAQQTDLALGDLALGLAGLLAVVTVIVVAVRRKR